MSDDKASFSEELAARIAAGGEGAREALAEFLYHVDPANGEPGAPDTLAELDGWHAGNLREVARELQRLVLPALIAAERDSAHAERDRWEALAGKAVQCIELYRGWASRARREDDYLGEREAELAAIDVLSDPDGRQAAEELESLRAERDAALAGVAELEGGLARLLEMNRALSDPEARVKAFDAGEAAAMERVRREAEAIFREGWEAGAAYDGDFAKSPDDDQAAATEAWEESRARILAGDPEPAEPCPACGSEERSPAGYLLCECPDPKVTARLVKPCVEPPAESDLAPIVAGARDCAGCGGSILVSLRELQEGGAPFYCSECAAEAGG
jgi:hypothetical protein